MKNTSVLAARAPRRGDTGARAAESDAERDGFAIRASAGFRGGQFLPKGAPRERIHRFMTYGTLSVASRAAQLDFHKEPSALEIGAVALTAGAGAAVSGAESAIAGGSDGDARVVLRRKRVEAVVIDRSNKRIAVKAAGRMGEQDLDSGWFGMQLRSVPEEIVEALRAAFGDKVREAELRSDHTRALVMLGVLVVLSALAAVARFGL